MRTRVVNLRTEEFDVYIGRAGHGYDGTFGNPIKRGVDGPLGSTLPAFETYFLERVDRDPVFRQRVLELKGKRLGCFCPPKKLCHGNIIVRWLDGDPEHTEQCAFASHQDKHLVQTRLTQR